MYNVRCKIHICTTYALAESRGVAADIVADSWRIRGGIVRCCCEEVNRGDFSLILPTDQIAKHLPNSLVSCRQIKYKQRL